MNIETIAALRQVLEDRGYPKARAKRMVDDLHIRESGLTEAPTLHEAGLRWLTHAITAQLETLLASADRQQVDYGELVYWMVTRVMPRAIEEFDRWRPKPVDRATTAGGGGR
jgi:hypothetical protein